MTYSKPEAAAVADLIPQLRLGYVGALLLLVLMNEEPATDWFLNYLRNPEVRLSRRRGEDYTLDVPAAVQAVRSSGAFNLSVMQVPLGAALVRLGDALSRHDYFDHAPILEFVRHLRNGVSHGNRFLIRPGEPRRPAHFRDLAITPALNGSPVLFDFLETGDCIDVLDAVEAHLRALS